MLSVCTRDKQYIQCHLWATSTPHGYRSTVQAGSAVRDGLGDGNGVGSSA
jgi:hypothetical protein